MKRERPPRPTMRHVAARAGVSAQTVSNVVNGRVHLMTEETRERVASVITDLGYHPNSAARGLRSARTHTLAFLVLDQDARFLADPMTDLIIAGIGDVARDRGYGVLIQAGRPDQESDALLTPLLEHRADGAFLFLSGEPAVRRWYVQRVVELRSPRDRVRARGRPAQHHVAHGGRSRRRAGPGRAPALTWPPSDCLHRGPRSVANDRGTAARIP